jgi:hypothetical protein
MIGLGFFVAARLDKSETDSDPFTSLALDSGTEQSAQGQSSGLTCGVTSARLLLTENTVRSSEQGNFSLVAAIRNVPTASGVRTVEGVRAYLKVKKQGKEICSGNGAWVNVFTNATTIRSGEEAQLVLAVLEEDTHTVHAITNSRNSLPPRLNRRNVERVVFLREQHTIHKHSLIDDALAIEVTLTDMRGRWCGTFNFLYTWLDGNITAILNASS